MAPVANCYAETWIGSFKRECLNHFFCFNLRHLDHIAQAYATYYSTHGPHQGLGNCPLADIGQPQPEHPDIDGGGIECQHWLGGLLTHDYRRAA